MKTDNGEKRIISVDSGTMIRGVLVLLLFVFLYLVRNLLLVVLASVVLASAAEPGVKWFVRKKTPRLLSVIIVYLLAAILISGIFYVFVPLLFEEMSNFLSSAPKYLQTLDLWTSQTVGIDLGGGPKGFSVAEFASKMKSFFGDASGGAFGALSAVFGGALSLILIIILSFYLAIQEHGISNFLKVVTPYQYHKYVLNIWERSQLKIGKWMQGQILLSIVVGVLVYLGLTVLGVKNAVILGILAAALEIIPIFGPVVSAVPALAISFVDGGLTQSFLVLGLYVIIQQFENHLLAPIVIHKVVGVSPVLVILAIIVGTQLAGFLGAILSVPIAATAMEFVEDIRSKHRKLDEMENLREGQS